MSEPSAEKELIAALTKALREVCVSYASLWHEEYDGTTYLYPDDLSRAEGLLAFLDPPQFARAPSSDSCK